jgi:hypothetical protein
LLLVNVPQNHEDAGVLTSQYTKLRLPAAKRSRLLGDVLDKVERVARDARPIVVFDLDGTLMDNRPRVAAILHELGDAWANRFPDVAACCHRATPDNIVYGFIENLRRLGIDDPELHEEGLEFWKARFFRDYHMKHDIEVPGARSFVSGCYERGATVVYLTGRDLPNMALGTLASLRDTGFPIGVIGTELVTKPTFEMPDAEFKRGVAPSFRRFGELVAVFDNEPENCNLFLDGYPDVYSVFLDTQHAPDPPPLHDRVTVIDTFER